MSLKRVLFVEVMKTLLYKLLKSPCSWKWLVKIIWMIFTFMSYLFFLYPSSFLKRSPNSSFLNLQTWLKYSAILQPWMFIFKDCFYSKNPFFLFLFNIIPPLEEAICDIEHSETTPDRWWLFRRSWRGVKKLPQRCPRVNSPFLHRVESTKYAEHHPDHKWFCPRWPFHSPTPLQRVDH